jgi:cytochrome b6
MRAVRALMAWLESRFGLGGLSELARKKDVPLHRHTVWYYFGGMTLFLFGIQVATGILLMLYYRPSPDGAFESVQFIVTKVPFGWLIRSIHSWSANLMIATAFIHLFSVFFLKAYRAPREMTWVSGFLLLLLAMGFGFSGYLLPWNKLAFFATQVGTDIAGAVPLVGEFVLRFLRGGDHVTGGTLSRFYGWHVAILPAITTFLLLVHLFLVQRHGMSVPASVERRRGGDVPRMPFVPHFLLRDLFGWVVALGALAALAALFPWELGEKADPFAPAFADIKPEWYFMFMFQTLKVVPGGQVLGMENEVWAILAFGALGLGALAIPFLDRAPGRVALARALTVLGAALLAFMAVMTAIGYRAAWPVAVTVLLIVVPWLAGRGMRRKDGP